MATVRPLAHLLAATSVVLAAGCGPSGEPTPGGTDRAAPATPLAVPSPSPARELAAVAGERVPAAHWVDASGLLTQRADEVGPPDTVLPFVHAVGDWLDAHLDDLQRGGPGRLGEVASPALLAAASDGELAAVTSALASSGAPVAAARYRLDAAYEDATEWLTATVEVTRTDGAVTVATMVFVPGASGPELVLFGPGGATGAGS
ncbi:MAG: hypothetical protein KY461_03420 [Actinobacteria bacterium]|nr:hypothetical protein [Actinomycetota bacterium]